LLGTSYRMTSLMVSTCSVLPGNLPCMLCGPCHLLSANCKSYMQQPVLTCRLATSTLRSPSAASRLKMRAACSAAVRPPSSQSVTSLSRTSAAPAPAALFQRLEATRKLPLQAVASRQSTLAAQCVTTKVGHKHVLLPIGNSTAEVQYSCCCVYSHGMPFESHRLRGSQRLRLACCCLSAAE
jgi:hypothetical protein